MDWKINLNAKMMTIVLTKLCQICNLHNFGVFVKQNRIWKKCICQLLSKFAGGYG